MIPDLSPREVARFYSKILIDGCGMLWDGPVNNHGYGRFEIYRDGQRVRILAHRLAFKLATGEDPDDSKVRHRCDTPPCVTPDCLESGTQADNIRDAIERGRSDTSGLTTYRQERDDRAAARINADEKPCSRCKTSKPMSDFFRSKDTPDGHAYWCKGCAADQQQHRSGMSERERRRLKRQRATAAIAPQPEGKAA